eukprot:SAG31_NODE_1339_length_8727_cov_6.433125_7_plen_183_part_00
MVQSYRESPRRAVPRAARAQSAPPDSSASALAMPPPSIRLLHQLVLLAPLALGGASTASDRRRKSWDDGAGRANAAAAPGSRAQLSEGVGGSSGASVPTAPLGAALPRRTPESVRPFEDRAAAGSGGAQAWKRILPAGACATAADCSLNGECIGGSCAVRSVTFSFLWDFSRFHGTNREMRD